MVRVQHGRKIKVVLNVPAPSKQYQYVTGEVDEVPGSGGRLILAQRFREVGEGAFSRDIQAWIIDARRDAVLWTGPGVYGNTNDACEWFDVPAAAVEEGQLVVWNEKAVDKLEPDAEDCDEEPLLRTEVARIPLD